MARFRLSTFALPLCGALGIACLPSLGRAQGSLFTATPVEESKFILVAAPIGKGEKSQLNIYEQRSDKRECFAVSGSSPAFVDPLLATFDFTGICNRYIDGNGYSLRIGGDDLGTRYRLSVIKTGQELQLQALPTRNSTSPSALIARSGGSGSGFLKLELEPGWRLMRRQYGQRALGHLYVYRDSWPGSSAAAESTEPSTSALEEEGAATP